MRSDGGAALVLEPTGHHVNRLQDLYYVNTVCDLSTKRWGIETIF